MELYMLTHHHRYGDTLYTFRSEDDLSEFYMRDDEEELNPLQKRLVEFFGIEYDEGRDESLGLDIVETGDIKTFVL
jgi:hypothetical protein